MQYKLSKSEMCALVRSEFPVTRGNQAAPVSCRDDSCLQWREVGWVIMRSSPVLRSKILCDTGSEQHQPHGEMLEWVESPLPAGRVADLRQPRVKHEVWCLCSFPVPLLEDVCRALWVARFLLWASVGLVCSEGKKANHSHWQIPEAKRNQRIHSLVCVLSFQCEASRLRAYFSIALDAFLNIYPRDYFSFYLSFVLPTSIQLIKILVKLKYSFRLGHSELSKKHWTY